MFDNLLGQCFAPSSRQLAAVMSRWDSSWRGAGSWRIGDKGAQRLLWILSITTFVVSFTAVIASRGKRPVLFPSPEEEAKQAIMAGIRKMYEEEKLRARMEYGSLPPEDKK
jgi:hypothetical protein